MGWNLALMEGARCFLCPVKRNRFPACTALFHWWRVVLRPRFFHFCWGAQPKHSAASVTACFFCRELLGTQTLLSLKNRLCWNCHVFRCTDLPLDLTVLSLSTCHVYRRWNTGTTPLYGTQRYWSTWPSTTQTARFTQSGTLLRTEDTGSHCSTAAPTETSSHKGKGLEKEKQVLREGVSQLWTPLFI